MNFNTITHTKHTLLPQRQQEREFLRAVNTAQKLKISITDFFSKYDQIHWQLFLGHHTISLARKGAGIPQQKLPVTYVITNCSYQGSLHPLMLAQQMN